MSFEVLCSKGSGSDESIVVTEADLAGLAGKKLSDLRTVLEKKKLNGQPFIEPDSSDSRFRFVMPYADREAEDYSDRLVGISTEKVICLSDMFINDKNQIILTNTQKKNRPDLIGFAADCWSGGKLRVRCRLNNSGDCAAKNRGKFQPLMLTNVVPTNERIQLYYQNVCICCEDSVVEFPMDCYGTVGFGYKAQLESGAVLRDSCMHWAIGDKNMYGGASVRFWDTEEGTREIVMKAIDHVSEIDPASKMRYQKLTFIARDMLSWINGDKGKRVIDVNTPSKNEVLYGRASVMSVKGLGQQMTIDGKQITPATPYPGDKIKVNYGNWWPKDFAPWENALGTVSVHLFVFTSLKEAEKFFGQYNMLPPEKQKKFWF